MAKKTSSSDGVALRGFFRVQVTGDGRVVGDSGWQENTVTNLGINQYLVNWLLGDTGSGKSVTHMALGTGGTAAAADTSLSGEVGDTSAGRAAVSTSVVSSKTAQFTAAFNSANSFITASKNISNVGLFNTSTTQAGTMFAGNTFASSSVATNQSVQVTYQIRIS